MAAKPWGPLWLVVLVIGIAALLIFTCEGCALGSKGIDASKAATVGAPEVHGDDARITNISLTSVGGYGWGGLATLAGFVLWVQKRTRGVAAWRMIRALEDTNHKDTKRIIRNRGIANGPRLRRDYAERWINKQVRRL
jgi:hypothetical protein